MSFEIDGRKVGPKCEPYIVAELSANHNGSLDRALKTIKAAKECGADAVKLQTYTADTMTIDCDKDDFMINGGLWDGYKLYDLYAWAETPYEWHSALFEYGREIGITVFSTPFDESAVDLLENLNTPAYKVASFEILDIPLIRYIAKTGKPIILSTGMASELEIREAVDAARSSGCKDLILLHCISSYPAPIDQSNIRRIPRLQDRFNVPVGLSDHTLGTTVSIAAVALGAIFIEKHFTISRNDEGPDSKFSLEPRELEELCHGAREAWMALGSSEFKLQEAERENQKFRRSLYITEDIKKGEILTSKNLKRIRPGYGVPPKYYDDILGKKVSEDLTKGTAVKLENLEI